MRSETNGRALCAVVNPAMSRGVQMSNAERVSSNNKQGGYGADWAHRSPVGIVGASTDPVRDYLQQIGQYPLLTAEDEVELAKAIEIGLLAEVKIATQRPLAPADLRELRQIAREGAAAHQRFICCNLKLVVSIAKRYAGRGVPFMDIIQEGNLGLDRAVKKFDYRQGFKFSTYAMWWIRQSITRSLADTVRLIRIPVHTMEKINKLGRIGRDISGVLGREATVEEIAREADLSVPEVIRLLGANREPVSLHMAATDDSVSELGDLIEDTDAVSVEEEVNVRLRDREIRRRVALLPERESKIIRLRYGMGSDSMTCSQVGEIFGVSRERIRQIEARALVMLRSPELQGLLDD